MTTVINIVLGLVGLGIVVFVHELGHFIAARLAGIDVEAFSIGWGNPILKKKIRGVEYRLGMFPVGGYCKMRGHDEIKGAVETGESEAVPAKGTFYGASPLRRIAVCFAGPLFNMVFAIIVLSVLWGAGREIWTQENRIVLASELNPQASYPADEVGLLTGDRIIEISGRPTSFSHEIRESFILNPDRLLPVTVERQGEIINLYIRPRLNRDTGAGQIGIHFWTDAIVAGIIPDGDAAIAGLLPGDKIVRMNGREVANTIDVTGVLRENPRHITVDFIRNGAEGSVELLATQAGGPGLGIMWPAVQYRTPSLSPPAALARGARETWRTLTVSVHSLSLLFRGINLTEAVSGPLRITYMVGDIATAGFGQNVATGLRAIADFLALISIAIGVMNLLPLPVLDGGQIVLYTVEVIRRKPTPPKALRVFQTVGVALIFGLMIFALFGDVMFLGRRLGIG